MATTGKRSRGSERQRRSHQRVRAACSSRVKPGEGDLPAGCAPGPAGDSLATGPGTTAWRSRRFTRHRFVLFDDDTRLAVHHELRWPVDAYMEDFFTSGPTLAAVRRHLPARRRATRAFQTWPR